ncbi:MAG TPA: glycosyltransferase family 2 protein [Gemmatimonadaceae bacterium]|nr:glycosyltransferase family 2 protein [Gemmatimonadaceae bacterium]
MLVITIPAYNEAPTIGLLLWRIRRVFEAYSREYEVIVLDDGSTDATPDTLRPYIKVLPLTVLRNEERRGYAAALDRLVRAASGRTRYPRRDAMIMMQGDFTDQPEHIPELVKCFEGGADLVVGEQAALPAAAPTPVRRLRRMAPWVVRPLVKLPGIVDPLSTFRLYRIALLRELLRDAGDAPIVHWDGWAANVELLMKLSALARRRETVPLESRYDLRPRESRVRPFAGVVDLYRFGRAAKAHRPERARSSSSAPTLS